LGMGYECHTVPH